MRVTRRTAMAKKMGFVSLLIVASSLPSGKLMAERTAPLKLVQVISLPDMKSGDFDHFALDLAGNRLFLTGEDNKSIEVFDLRTNKRIHSIKGVDTPHSMVFLPDADQLLVVDGGDGTLKCFDAKKYTVTETVKLELAADSAAYDPARHLLYVASGGEDAKMDTTMINIVDTNSRKRVADITVDSKNIEAMALEQNGPRLYVNIRDRGLVGVVDRDKRTVLSTWPLDGLQGNTPMALDEPNHRLFIVSRKPAKLLVLDSDSGKVITSLPSAPLADDMVFDAASKRIYVACDGFVSVYHQQDADHYEEIARVPTTFRAKTAILVPAMNRYYVAAPRHGQQAAEVRVYDVQ
jgi:DNA-binding beta-propeller fold protein YncE